MVALDIKLLYDIICSEAKEHKLLLNPAEAVQELAGLNNARAAASNICKGRIKGRDRNGDHNV